MNLKKITDYIFLNSRAEKADIAIVFGTQNPLCIKAVKEIYEKKLVNKIIISGGINRYSGENEAQFLAKALIEEGIPADTFILETKAENSLQNVVFSKNIIEEQIGLNNVKKIIAVVKHFHSRRAIMTMKKHFPKHIKILPFVYNVGDFTKENWYESKNGLTRVLEEWKKIPIYLANGDIEELEKEEKLKPTVMAKLNSFKDLLGFYKNRMALKEM